MTDDNPITWNPEDSGNWRNSRCPICGDGDHIDVSAQVDVRLTYDGSDSDEATTGDHEYDDDSTATCSCGHTSKLAEFNGPLLLLTYSDGSTDTAQRAEFLDANEELGRKVLAQIETAIADDETYRLPIQAGLFVDISKADNPPATTTTRTTQQIETSLTDEPAMSALAHTMMDAAMALVAAAYPEITSGDFDPGATHAMLKAMKAAAITWIAGNNTPPRQTDRVVMVNLAYSDDTTQREILAEFIAVNSAPDVDPDFPAAEIEAAIAKGETYRLAIQAGLFVDISKASPNEARPIGERSTCQRCGQDIEWVGKWWDRGGNTHCVPYRGNDGEIVTPNADDTHYPND